MYEKRSCYVSSKLFAGAGRAIITPPIGTILYGYAPGRPAESVADDLDVTAVAVESGGQAAILLSATLCSIKRPLSDRLRAAIGDMAGIPAANVILAMTHTHSGPNVAADSGWGKYDSEYVENFLVPGAIKAATEAWNSRKPALLGIGTTQSDVGINRREMNRNGTISLGQNPWAPYDPTMTVLSFKAEDSGEPIVNIIHYCAHGTGSGMNPEVTRDWSGPMVDRLEEISGGMTTFFNGAEGDLGPRLSNGKTTGNLELAYELGGRASIDAVRAWRSIKTWRDEPVSVFADDIKLPYLALPSREEAEKELAKLADVDSWPENHLKYQGINEKQRWEGIIAEYESGKPHKTHMVLPQSVVAVGRAAFVPFPFEIFVEVTLRIRQFSPYEHTLCLSNSNYSISYFPTKDQIVRGGYEVWGFTSANVYTLVNNADDYAVGENLRLLEAMASK